MLRWKRDSWGRYELWANGKYMALLRCSKCDLVAGKRVWFWTIHPVGGVPKNGWAISMKQAKAAIEFVIHRYL